MSITTTSSNSKILIIGAGLGGLALAHGLKKFNIPFHIFERDDTASWRAQGYRIRIMETSLRKLLSDRVWDEFESSCAELAPGMNRIDALTGEEVKVPIGAGPGHGRGGPPPGVLVGQKARNVDRTVLRNIMLKDMVKDGNVTFGKKLIKYELHDNGVTAFFEDGTKFQGKMLIGADGTRSMVRKQMLPDYKILDTEGRAIFGKTPIVEDTFNLIPNEVRKGICVISNRLSSPTQPPITLFCDTMTFKNRDQVQEIELPTDYIYWVLCFHKTKLDISDHEFMTLTKQNTVTQSLTMTSTWHKSVQEILNRQLPSASSPLAFLTAPVNLPEWSPNPKITLLGDAAHPMTPVGGAGANGAFDDAVALYELLKQSVSEEGMAMYEKEMRERATIGLKTSAAGAGRFFGMKKFDELEVQTLWD